MEVSSREDHAEKGGPAKRSSCRANTFAKIWKIFARHSWRRDGLAIGVGASANNYRDLIKKYKINYRNYLRSRL